MIVRFNHLWSFGKVFPYPWVVFHMHVYVINQLNYWGELSADLRFLSLYRLFLLLCPVTCGHLGLPAFLLNSESPPGSPQFPIYDLWLGNSLKAVC